MVIEKPHFLKLSVTEEHRSFSIRCNRLARSRSDYDNTLYFVSGAGTATAVKAFSAMLHSRRAGTVWVGNWPNFPDQYLFTSEGGYVVHRHRLGLDQWQIMAWTENWWFLASDSDDHLWAILKGEHYTTPILRRWMPALRAQLKKRQYLRPLSCYRCTSHLLYVVEQKLDELVSEGVACGELTMEE